MKFSWKILLCTMLIMAAACGASGYFFVNYVFQTSMERETRQALDESSILRFAFETAALNIPSKYDVLPSDQFSIPDKKYLYDRVSVIRSKRNNVFVLAVIVRDFLFLCNLLHAV